MAFLIDTLSDKRIQLGSECFIRTMSIGTNWQKIRIGFRLAFNDTLTSITGRLVAGVSQGVIPVSSYNVVDFVGATMGSGNYNSPSTLPRTVNAGVLCIANANLMSPLRKQGEIVTQGSLGGNSSTYVSVQPGISHSAYFLTLAKSGTSYMLSASGAPSGADITRATFLTIMENEGEPPGGMASMNVNPITGALLQIYDTVQISWNKSLPTIELSDITVVRYY